MVEDKSFNNYFLNALTKDMVEETKQINTKEKKEPKEKTYKKGKKKPDGSPETDTEESSSDEGPPMIGDKHAPVSTIFEPFSDFALI